ncbi:MFS general substrate transporter [Dacryopinax primogenitus]|uniref:MFS general substrate transporter n=1 Tax=Dacryopinax primogenitus (strain DJM 731) TaxID=1858805 RepID=M5G6P6_DACPD|nr:MFS general substrate transporter [Dacryopinax primogenitus]EJU04374.1 MFS general substrate transporter [Dacryopinax primogenitus]
MEYRLYKRRWIGLIALVMLNLAAAMNWLWFSPIANSTVAQWNLSYDNVNWLANSVNLIYLPISLAVPISVEHFGLQPTCAFGAFMTLASAWVRYAAAKGSHNATTTFAVFMVSSVLNGIGQPIFQVLAPKYSERWFDLRERTTATMLIAVSNPIGAALAQLIAPAVGSNDILVLAIITSVLTVPAAFCVLERPPTPPTFAASTETPSMFETLRDVLFPGKGRPGKFVMTRRQRWDFVILTIAFGNLVGAFTAMSVLLNQFMVPYGYSADTAGFVGAAFLLSGIVAACVTAPIYDRYLTHHLAMSAKFFVSALGIVYITLIWGIKANDLAGIYTQFVLIGICSFILLPVALELGCEVSRNAETSSAIFWCSANLMSVIYILVEGALRAPADADPPFNMHRSIIFQSIIVLILCVIIFGLEGRQARREMDTEKAAEAGRDSRLGDQPQPIRGEVGESSVHGLALTEVDSRKHLTAMEGSMEDYAEAPPTRSRSGSREQFPV